jgi:hypothetical protein
MITLIRSSVCFALASSLCVQSGCAQSITYPAPLTGSSKTLAVRGEYAPVALDRIEGVAIENGKIVLRGSSASVVIDPPASADVAKPTRHWALVTEADAGGRRALTFTHSESLDDFTIELPATEEGVRYGAFSGTGGNEVMVLAWATESRSYWGYVTIERLAGGPQR